MMEGMAGGGKEREQPAAAAPASGLINLMVSVDNEGLSEDGVKGGQRRYISLLRKMPAN